MDGGLIDVAGNCRDADIDLAKRPAAPLAFFACRPTRLDGFAMLTDLFLGRHLRRPRGWRSAVCAAAAGVDLRDGFGGVHAAIISFMAESAHHSSWRPDGGPDMMGGGIGRWVAPSTEPTVSLPSFPVFILRNHHKRK